MACFHAVFVFRAFGEVWLAVQLYSNKKFAIKSVRRQGKSHEPGIDAFDQLKNEAHLLCNLQHPNIVKVVLSFSQHVAVRLTSV